MLPLAPEKDVVTPAPMAPASKRRHRAGGALLDPQQLAAALPEALRKLHPG